MDIDHAGIQQGSGVSAATSTYQNSHMVKAVMRMGIAKTEKQANLVLLIFSMFNFLASAIILLAAPTVFI